MSTDVLREAAAQMRRAWSEEGHRGYGREASFYRAVADWLEQTVGEISNTDWKVETHPALVVARTYLGETP